MGIEMAGTVLVTGASSGIGEETAKGLLKAGYIVYAGARRVDAMRSLEAAGARALSLDVTDDASMTAAVDAILRETGRIDVLVNNAGYGSFGALEDVPLDEGRRQFEVNVFGLARLTQLVLPTMRAQRAGRIVNVSSASGKVGEPFAAWYHASKHALEGLSDSLRMELHPFGIDVVIIEPGPTRTPWGGIARNSLTLRSGKGAYRDGAQAHIAMLVAASKGSMPSAPSDVAAVIVKAVRSRRPKTRYPVGGAKIVLILRRILSDRGFDAFIRLATDQARKSMNKAAGDQARPDRSGRSASGIRFVLTRIVPALLVVVLAFFAYIKIQYGMGKPYPDVGDAHAPGRYEKLVKLDYPPGNIAVAANGDIYFNYHPIVKAQRFTSNSMFKLSDGRVTPFPSLAMQKELSGVFGMAIGPGNRLWMIAPASFDGDHTALLAFDLNTGQRVLSFTFPGKAAQFAQDLRVTADGNYVLLADPGLFRFTDPKLIVFSVRDLSFRVALGATPCTVAQDWLMRTPFGPYRMLGGLINFTVGLDGIAISPDQRWFYLGPMTSDKLCRVPLQTLLDPALKPEQVASKVEYIGHKPISDGIATDTQGRVILGMTSMAASFRSIPPRIS
jgi:NAD(P)-dependent dehydrogenase (short-subunit alcohol dehydrogenase family)/sugar lactone lactonase YvrE